MIKWVARLAFVTVLLGLVGTILIVRNMHKKQDGEDIRKNQTDTLPHDLYHDTPNIKRRAKRSASSISTTAQEEKKETPTLTFSRQKKPDDENAAGKESPAINAKKINDDAIETRFQKEGIKDHDQKLLTQNELQELIKRINAAKEENAIYSNCVQIYTTTQGNNTTAISQIETYLRTQRFAIAGRESISKKVKGIQISPAGGCIRITIGSF